jgi:iron complex transport system substrate-binding protein
MRALLLAVMSLLAAGCGRPDAHAISSAAEITGGEPMPLEYAKTFRVFQRDGYRIVDLKASIISWGGAAEGPKQHIRVVVVPKDGEVPPLQGDLAGSLVVRTPVARIATNHAPVEAMLRVLGVADRLVAVGGVKSYDDAIRKRTLDGQIAQIGYGWHSPPNLDALLAAKPDVMFMAMGDVSHTGHLQRIQSFGVPVMPLFLDAEVDYMARVEYIRLVGLLTGREAEAERYVLEIASKVEHWKQLAATQPQKTVISAWFSGADVWMATVRNADAKLLRDANAVNLLQEADSDQLDSLKRLGTEVLLQRGSDADCWVLRDTHSVPFERVATLQKFKSYRERCVFAADGMTKPEADAFDLYETAIIRPDLLLADYVRMLHPSLRDGTFVYVRPDSKVPG